VQINVVAQSAGCNHGIVLVLVRQLHKGVISLGVNHCAIGNPAHFVLGRLHPVETASALEHLERFAVRHFAYAIGNSGNAIAQVHLPGPDIDRLVLLLSQLQPGTTHRKCKEGKDQDTN